MGSEDWSSLQAARALAQGAAPRPANAGKIAPFDQVYMHEADASLAGQGEDSKETVAEAAPPIPECTCAGIDQRTFKANGDIVGVVRDETYVNLMNFTTRNIVRLNRLDLSAFYYLASGCSVHETVHRLSQDSGAQGVDIEWIANEVTELIEDLLFCGMIVQNADEWRLPSTPVSNLGGSLS